MALFLFTRIYSDLFVPLGLAQHISPSSSLKLNTNPFAFVCLLGETDYVGQHVPRCRSRRIAIFRHWELGGANGLEIYASLGFAQRHLGSILENIRLGLGSLGFQR